MNLTRTTNEPSIDMEALHRQITQRAYELYEQRGRQEGFAMQDWLQAQQELRLHASVEDRPAEKFLVRRAV
jgi:hypothetical protein